MDMLGQYTLRTRGKDHFTYKNLFGITNSPGKIQNIAIGLDYLGRQLNAEPATVISYEDRLGREHKDLHLVDGENNSLRKLAIPLNQTAKLFLDSLRRNLGIAVKAIADNRQQSVLHGSLHDAIAVNEYFILGKTADADLERSGDGHDIV